MKKLLTLMLVTVTTLTALGVGYALWSETLTIAGTVSTGTVDINFSGGNTAYDDESLESGGVDSLVENGGDPDTTVEDKDVGTCTESDGVGSQSYSITVGTAYPSYDCFFHFDINYQGTIPAHVQVTQILPTGGNGAFPLQLLHLNCTFDDAQGGGPVPHAGPFALVFNQLHEGAVLDCNGRIHFTNEEALANNIGQGQTYTIGWTITAKQYNEWPITQ